MSYYLLLPEIILTIIALCILTIGTLLPEDRQTALGYLALVGLIIALLSTLVLSGVNQTAFSDMVIIDPFSLFFKRVFLVVASLVILTSISYTKEQISLGVGEYYFIILLATVGMMFLASAIELVTLFISIELVSASSYILVAYRGEKKSAEAGLKYLIYGVPASAVLLYGLSILFALTGHTDFASIGDAVNRHGMDPFLIIGLTLVIGGLCFKAAVVPFHMWVPDVYEGAPTPITAFLAAGSKAAVLAVIMRIFLTVFMPVKAGWVALFIVLSILSMGIGNLAAIPQTNIKRLLAYSSIGHVGYILIGLICATKMAASSILFYIVVYALAIISAFTVVVIVSSKIGSDEIKGYVGLSKRSPFLALVLLISLISLAGIPPMAGFIGKFYIFAAAIEHNLLWLVLIAIICSVISIYYYFQIIKSVYLFDPEDTSRIPVPASLFLMLSAITVSLFVIGIFPSPFLKAATSAISDLF
ncbi:MAG: NADH-quinone oxidoreductase subunit N [Candidatus Brocadiales bacterium]